jgi:hypothetical protein
MKYNDFTIGMMFSTPTGSWRVTDLGARTIIAIKIGESDPRDYNGPPYSVSEVVFDEHDFAGCSADPALARALLVLGRKTSEEMNGAALAVLRMDAMTGVHDAELDHEAAASMRAVLMGLTAADMPPSTDLVWIMLETASQRLGGISRAMVWHAIGIKEGRGRDLLARNASAVDWPIWYTLRKLALG